MRIPIISLILFSTLILITVRSFLARKHLKILLGLIITYIGFLFFIWLENKFGFEIYDFVLILVTITIFAHFYFGENLRLYYKTKYFDRYLHLFGTMAFTLCLYLIIIRTLKPVMSPNSVIFVFVVALGALIGVIFELCEFTADMIFKTKKQRGLIDTDVDLIFDIIGATLAGSFVLYFPKLF
ncbi:MULTISPECIES: hypothetical protein [unclassified Dehalobacter]|uniref:hypothetical protein n=1 Tax=unclassified Dehalobacter TaxID=2635733 RepID=UPI0003A20567|nr:MULTISPECIES: hypothetical protein [unclassified Dehalobacter]TCX51727.1 hypothetical protein C1I36_05200 [Dehalobacter sp. 14DCB1]TCX52787.1 hypothetical protein C1I38_06880 [Dehalobacter sp. 12DCB1]